MTRSVLNAPTVTAAAVLPDATVVRVNVTVTAADAATRRLRGRIVPYGQVGDTNVGRLVVMGPGRLRMPDPLSRHVLLWGHGPEAPSVGVAVEVEDLDDGLWVEFAVAEGELGDQLLAEADPTADAPVRTGLSFELHDVTWEDVAHLDALGVRDALVLATASVPIPAFPDARVATVVATFHQQEGTDPMRLRSSRRSRTTRDPVEGGGGGTAVVEAPAPVVEAPAATGAPTQAVVEAAAVLPVGHPTAGTGVATDAPAATGAGRAPRVVAGIRSLADYSGALAGIVRGDRGVAAVEAALADLSNAHSPERAPAQFEGELWRGAAYSRRWASFFTPKPLNNWRIEGYRWTVPPTVDEWQREVLDAEGNPTGEVNPIPSSGEVATELVAAPKPTRFAGGEDIDRAVVDFHQEHIVREYLALQAEDYAVKTDSFFRVRLLAMVVSAMTDAGVLTSAVPADFAGLTKPADLLEASAVARLILQETPNVRQAPDFLLVNSLDWLALGKILKDELPAFLDLLGVKPDQLQPDLKVPRGRLVAGVRAAQNKYEFGEDGEPPIRVEALNIVKGSVTGGVFGYATTLNARPGGVISLPFGALA